MEPKTKSELMAEWASRSDQLKREREVKAIRKAMDDARAVMQDGLLEVMGKPLLGSDEDVLGYLTADDVLRMMKGGDKCT